MEIKLNGYNLNDTSVKTNEIQFDTAPPIEVHQLDIAGSDGSKFVASRYGTKIIKILGYITAASQSALETALDTFKQSILDQENIKLNISYAGGYRQFIGNVSSFIWTKRHHNITFQPFEIEFTVGDPPFAYSVSTIDSDPIYEEAFSAKDFTGNSLSHTLTFEGTAKPKAKWTYLLNTISGQTAQLVFKSKTTGKQMEINGAFTPGDQLEIDQDDYSVKLNGFDQDYEGVFPEFERGANEFEWQIYGTNSEKYGVSLNTSQVTGVQETNAGQFNSNRLSQGFKLEYNGIVDSVDIMLYVGTDTGSLYLEIRNDLAGSPGTLVQTSDVIQLADLAKSYSWTKFNFNTDTTLVAGTQYHIVLVPVDCAPFGIYWIRQMGGDVYANGNAQSSGDSGVSYSDIGLGEDDMNFKIYTKTTLSSVFNHTSSLKVEYKRLYL